MKQQYESAWQRYRRFRLIGFLGLIAFFPVGFAFASMMASPGAGTFNSEMAVFFILVSPMLISDFMLRVFKCPRCKRVFFGGFLSEGVLGRMMTKRCVHCGLNKFASDDVES